MVGLLYLVLGFLCGSIPFSWFLGRLRGVDLRQTGSGNPGATNLLRSCGKGMGIAGLLLDALKGAVPVYIALLSGLDPWVPVGWSSPRSWAMCSCPGSVSAEARGGNGPGGLLVLGSHAGTLQSGDVPGSRGPFQNDLPWSILGGLALPGWGFVFGEPAFSLWVLGAIALAIVVTHRSNILRILNGTERKLGQRNDQHPAPYAEPCGKDLKVRYKRSMLGFLWFLLKPLFSMAVYTIVFTRIIRFGGSIEHFSLFLLTGLLPWNFFSASLSSSARTLLDNQKLIRSIYFPRAALPVSAVIANAVHMLMAMGCWRS